MAVLFNQFFWVPGFIKVPGDDGNLITVNFRARFKRLKKSEREALDHRIEANKLTPEIRDGMRAGLDDPKSKYSDFLRKQMESVLVASPITDTEFCREVLVDLDMKDSEGKPVIYTPKVVEELDEELDGFEKAVVRAYFRVRQATANQQDVEKNSETQSGTTSS